MNHKKSILIFSIIVFLIFGLGNSARNIQNLYLGPSDLVFSKKENYLYIAEHDGKQLDVFDKTKNGLVKSIPLKDNPAKLFISGNDDLIILQGIEEGKLVILDKKKLKLKKEIPIGHSPVDVVETKEHLIVCNRFPGEITFLNKVNFQIESKLRVGREPIAMVLNPINNALFVVHHLPEMASTEDWVASKITVIDAEGKYIKKTLLLPNGSSSVKDIALTPDGKFAFVTHILARYHLPTTQLERGWMNTNALSILNIEEENIWQTILLDDIDHGSANPWAVECSDDGEKLFVSHAGTHEVSIIDWLSMKDAIEEFKENRDSNLSENLGFIYPFRERVELEGNGARALSFDSNTLFIANYFTDNLSIINLKNREEELYKLGEPELTTERRGEMFFNDASLCFQTWQSCASCHPDARVDGLNWDLLNDGIGNPKNARSMLLSHKTPPVMSLGVRSHAKVAVRAGFKYIQFTEVPEEYSSEVDVYIESLKPLKSPFAHSDTEKGKALFESLECNHCHSEPLYTDLKSYAIGEDNSLKWDTPTLVELWRTAPYWHDGRYATLKELFNKEMHGLHEPLSLNEMNELEKFLLIL